MQIGMQISKNQASPKDALFCPLKVKTASFLCIVLVGSAGVTITTVILLLQVTLSSKGMALENEM
jgi:hypothetical protein